MATRWGILGAGKISHDFATAVETLPESEHKLIAVAAQDLSRAMSFAKVHDIASAYGSYQELAKNKDIEVVYIGTLNPSHLELSKMMLNAGKHVLCEKPLTMNLKQTKELIEYAKDKGLFLMEAIWSRCFPAYDILRREITNGSIGEVKQVIVSFGAQLDNIDRVYQKKLGGGVTLDLGVYTIQFASLIFNHEKPLVIKAAGHLNEEGVDQAMSATLIYPNKRTATIIIQSLVQLPNEANVIGTKGTICLPSFWSPSQIRLANGEIREYPLPKAKHTFNFTNSAGLSYEATEVRKCLKKGLKESTMVLHAHSLLIAEIEDEVRRQLGVVYEEDQ